MKAELTGYLLGLSAIAAFISSWPAALVYLSLNALLVRPMQRITRAMERFRADPEDPAAHVHLSGRRDEIGRAEAELDRMQADLRVALSSRARLAALGEAVAKINHDLRNMLTSAQIASERLAQSRRSQGRPGPAAAGARPGPGGDTWPPTCWPTARARRPAPDARPARPCWPRWRPPPRTRA